MSNEHSMPDPLQGHTREWPSTPYSDEVRAPEPRIDSSCSIVLFGDCTVAGTLWPPANRPDNHLRVRLRRAFAGQPFRVCNAAKDGDTAGGFVSSGRFHGVLAGMARLDIAIIRYGINDRKYHGVDGCIQNLADMCRLLRDRYPEISVIVETGIWVDYPRHYLWDRNVRLAPLYEAMKDFAQSQGIPVLDVFSLMREETECGRWDLRVRGLPSAEFTVLDASLDEFYGDDPAYYSNIHPNSTAMALIAEWQVALLRRLFGERLPGIEAKIAGEGEAPGRGR